MKTISTLFCMALFAGAVAPSYSLAETRSVKVVVRVNEKALVTIEGGEGIVKLVQFCPDTRKKSCDENIVVKRDGNSFQLDKEALGYHQTAFNFVFDTGKWLKIPDEVHVTIPPDPGNFVNIDPEGEEGAYFVYIGPIPAR